MGPSGSTVAARSEQDEANENIRSTLQLGGICVSHEQRLPVNAVAPSSIDDKSVTWLTSHDVRSLLKSNAW